MGRIISFLKDVRMELAKVNWPTRKELLNYTLIVIGLSLVIAIFLGGIDYGLEALLKTFVLK